VLNKAESSEDGTFRVSVEEAENDVWADFKKDGFEEDKDGTLGAERKGGQVVLRRVLRGFDIGPLTYASGKGLESAVREVLASYDFQMLTRPFSLALPALFGTFDDVRGPLVNALNDPFVAEEAAYALCLFAEPEDVRAVREHCRRRGQSKAKALCECGLGAYVSAAKEPTDAGLPDWRTPKEPWEFMDAFDEPLILAANGTDWAAARLRTLEEALVEAGYVKGDGGLGPVAWARSWLARKPGRLAPSQDLVASLAAFEGLLADRRPGGRFKVNRVTLDRSLTRALVDCEICYKPLDAKGYLLVYRRTGSQWSLQALWHTWDS
jgi:hypothetical protein